MPSSTKLAVQLKQALDQAIEEFIAHEIGSPRLNAETLMMFTLGCDRAYLYAHPERELSNDEAERYEQAVNERARGRPSQYITGHQEFWGLDLIVTPAVLIPRPETEHIVEMVLELAAAWENSSSRAKRGSPATGIVQKGNGALRIVDVGTGSGCIALALAHELPDANIHAADISEEALEVARINCERLNMASRVELRRSDLLEAFAENETFDFIVCNPPYVSELRPETVQKQVREFEPRVAVFSGPSGLEAYERLIPQARQRLAHGGWLVMEIGYSIENDVRALLEGWSDVRVKPDLQGIPRVITARL